MQVRDFLMRVRSRRFPSIEKDMKMVLAHCGSLFLDPAALAKVQLVHMQYIACDAFLLMHARTDRSSMKGLLAECSNADLNSAVSANVCLVRW